MLASVHEYTELVLDSFWNVSLRSEKFIFVYLFSLADSKPVNRQK